MADTAAIPAVSSFMPYTSLHQCRILAYGRFVSFLDQCSETCTGTRLSNSCVMNLAVLRTPCRSDLGSTKNCRRRASSAWELPPRAGPISCTIFGRRTTCRDLYLFINTNFLHLPQQTPTQILRP